MKRHIGSNEDTLTCAGAGNRRGQPKDRLSGTSTGACSLRAVQAPPFGRSLVLSFRGSVYGSKKGSVRVPTRGCVRVPGLRFRLYFTSRLWVYSLGLPGFAGLGSQ